VAGGHDLGWGRRRDAALPGRIAQALVELVGSG
jgi:hypothetical protein